MLNKNLGNQIQLFSAVDNMIKGDRMSTLYYSFVESIDPDNILKAKQNAEGNIGFN